MNIFHFLGCRTSSIIVGEACYGLQQKLKTEDGMIFGQVSPDQVGIIIGAMGITTPWRFSPAMIC